jgi:hypothetical protein
MSKVCVVGGGRNPRHPALAEVQAVRIRRGDLAIPTANDLPPYSPDEISQILADLGIDAASSSGRVDQLDELLRDRRTNKAVVLSLIYREIEQWGEGTP